ncbi:YueI family protein [Sediminibacillus massiliensis]|uniref:YueI family protein n=1 Tax=Sediminibacillus massiliensis TaxID=1926277 RepID=UPI00098887D7|nr:YueI family protein [Sediminibacillus massiliensis]
MSRKDVDDYIQEGIYGAKQTKPGERKRYLGTLRERVILALTKGQVMKNKGHDELLAGMKEHPDSRLLFNGNINSRFLKDYKNMAREAGIQYSSITNKEAKTDLGAILTSDHAIDKENIYLEEAEEDVDENTVEEQELSDSSPIKKAWSNLKTLWKN